jgi:hypothetical protein
MARPLPKQRVEKGKIWTVFIGGATVLFLTTIALENNPQLFPAITRANDAMRKASERMKVRSGAPIAPRGPVHVRADGRLRQSWSICATGSPDCLPAGLWLPQEQEERKKKEAELMSLRQKEFDAQQRQLSAVQDGLKAAKAKVLADAPAAPRPPVAAAAPAAASAPAEHAPSPSVGVPSPPPAVTVPLVLRADEGGPVASSSAAAAAPVSPQASHNGSEPASASASSASPYVVVEDVAGSMGAVAWPSGEAAVSSSASEAAAVAAPATASSSRESAAAVVAAVAAAAATTGGVAAPAQAAAVGAAAGSEEEAEALARLARLQVSERRARGGGAGAPRSCGPVPLCALWRRPLRSGTCVTLAEAAPGLA